MRQILCLVIFMTLISQNVFAENWVSRWVDQKTYSGPDYFSTQERGYGSLGTYSARWQNQTLQPVSFTKPRFEVGCGGIDLFLGGFNFMQMDHLVKKMKKIMGPAAAAFAFDIALGTLSAQARQSMGKLMAVIDRLNQLQFDECNAGKALVATVTDTVNPSKKGSEKTAAITSYMQESGVTDLWTDVTGQGKGTTPNAVATASGTSLIDAVSGCPADLKDIFFTSGSMLSHIGNKNSLDDDQIDLIRGLIGDVQVDTAGGDISYMKVDPCSQNSTKLLDAIVTGGVQKKNSAGVCSAAGSITVGGVAYTSMKDWVATELVNIGHNVRDKNNITSSQATILSQIPPPVLNVLQSYIAYSGTNSNAAITKTAIEYADYISSLLAYNMLGDIYAGLGDTLSLALTIHSAQSGASNPANNQNCKLELSDNGFYEIKAKQKSVLSLMNTLHEEFQGKSNQILGTIQISQLTLQRSQTFKKHLKKNLGGYLR